MGSYPSGFYDAELPYYVKDYPEKRRLPKEIEERKSFGFVFWLWINGLFKVNNGK